MMYFNAQLMEYWGITDGAVVDSMGKQYAPTLLILFGDAFPVKHTLCFMDRANTTVNALLPSAPHQADF